MCIASGRTLPSPARTQDRVHLTLTLARSHTGLAATGTTSKAGLRAKQTHLSQVEGSLWWREW